MRVSKRTLTQYALGLVALGFLALAGPRASAPFLAQQPMAAEQGSRR